MPHRTQAVLSLALVTAALLACKKKDDADTAPSATLPTTPETPVAPETTETPPTTDPTTTAAPSPNSPATPAKPGTVPKPTTSAAPSTADAGTAAAKDAGSAPKPASGPSKECVQKCQGVMQTCLTPRTGDGGMPQLPDPTKCQQAFTDCQAACK